MKYFLISADEKCPQPRFLDWYHTLDPRVVEAQEREKIPRVISFKVDLPEEAEFMDVVSYPFFMVSKEFSYLLRTYDPNIEFKYAVLFDKTNRRSKLYALPLLEKVDCLSKRSKYNLDKSMLKRGILCAEKAAGKDLFQIGGVEERYVAASLELVESIYRREVRGIHIEELELEHGKVVW